MIYQIYYDENSLRGINPVKSLITPCGVHKAKDLPRDSTHIYDDEKRPNLTEHNTLCEWRVLFYMWKHHPSPWIGFTSWQHDKKKFKPTLADINKDLCVSALRYHPIAGFCIIPLKKLILTPFAKYAGITLKSVFAQWTIVERLMGCQIKDKRCMPLGKYHDLIYWDFVINEYRSLYGVNLEKDLDFLLLGQIDYLHTWCNAFVARWDYFDEYMTRFSPIVLAMLEHFGSHPTDLELAYICERLIVLHNYIKFSNNEWRVRRTPKTPYIDQTRNPSDYRPDLPH